MEAKEYYNVICWKVIYCVAIDDWIEILCVISLLLYYHTMTLIVIVLLVCLCLFEFINGFHDTANAVATVIYTKTLKPFHAVVYSGVLNFLWVLIGGVWVAYSIVKLIPVWEIISFWQSTSLLVVLWILFTSILRNLYTRYKWLPCSSSHTLIWSIVWAVIGFCMLKVGSFDIVNVSKIKDIMLWLLLSPVIGFSFTLLVVTLFKLYYNKAILFHKPYEGDATPPWYIRTMLLMTCGLVSYFHWSNDGQKWIWLGVVILILLAPALYGDLAVTQIVPLWLILMISLSLGLGTMIGRKRIVVTIWEKIGKEHLSYIQWATAELMAAITIWLSTYFHLPVSTTHTLSSGVAGSMFATWGHANLQWKTLRSILLAWILTLPVCIIIATAFVYFLGLLFGL